MNAFTSPDDLVVKPNGLSMSDDVTRMKGLLLKNIKRSAYVYRVDCGGCNGCEIEIFAAITPLFDAERFGIKVVASPRHADILLFTGAVTRAMRMPALRAYEAAPEPKIVVSYGACGCSGGIFHDLYCVWGGTDKIVPVDVYIPGCPPTPPATIYGFAVALGLLDQKLKAETYVEAEGEAVPLAHPAIPYNLRVLLEREARQMAGYRQGRDIVEEFLSLLEADDRTSVEARVGRLIGGETDPRRAEIFSRLQAVFTQALVGGVS
ncbi:NADH-quinone oxidoreductase subunit B family protein [Telmatospirillum sp.]|uniref:NADH-quinone oxidoreductase subunit B family protein n=1 Tax=Telmatospirillum sp. TaxID=2079197 RepID=UPI0028495EB4|nr:NADH-quinone oxidoreductase subunit B family protein [Telmatospirillum sp.]MDR3438352.1 NADH-quinone oxidoreductase subunit B family protein [Telmatospirillum sp.]